MVVTDMPSTCAASTVQDFTDSPSRSTVQAPQLEVSQPTFVPVRSRFSRRKWTRSVLGSASAVISTPFTLTLMRIRTPALVSFLGYPSWQRGALGKHAGGVAGGTPTWNRSATLKPHGRTFDCLPNPLRGERYIEMADAEMVEGASITAFRTAGVEPMVLDSPIPLAPSGRFGGCRAFRCWRPRSSEVHLRPESRNP